MDDQAEAKIPAEETVFFKEGDVVVTNARFIASKTHVFAMSGITSIKLSIQRLPRMGSYLVIFLGIFILYWGISSWYLCMLDFPLAGYIALAGCIIILLGIWRWYARRPIFYVMLKSSSTEEKTLPDRNPKRVKRVIKALNDAIVHRG